MGWYYDYRPYVPVAARRAQATREAQKLAKKGHKVQPVKIEGRKITTTFWGDAWCDNLESYSDFANRLPRGRTYVRNGSVVDLQIAAGNVTALVSGSEIYTVKITIDKLPPKTWQAVKSQCAGQIGTLVELLQGKLSKAVMAVVTDKSGGLFPKPLEIKMRCSCPDYAGMCKHVAAVMYGVGNRLDSSPELLFVLRGVDQRELIEQAIPTPPAKGKGKSRKIAAVDLGDVFGIDIGEPPPPAKKPRATQKPAAAKARKSPPIKG